MRRRNKIGFSSSTFLPSIRIAPEVGSIKRLTMRSRVVLPEPEVPTSIQVVPSCSSNVTASTAGLAVPSYCLVIFSNAIFAMRFLIPPNHFLTLQGRKEVFCGHLVPCIRQLFLHYMKQS